MESSALIMPFSAVMTLFMPLLTVFHIVVQMVERKSLMSVHALFQAFLTSVSEVLKRLLTEFHVAVRNVVITFHTCWVFVAIESQFVTDRKSTRLNSSHRC